MKILKKCNKIRKNNFCDKIKKQKKAYVYDRGIQKKKT